jgi:predicted Zn-dependent protease
LLGTYLSFGQFDQALAFVEERLGEKPDDDAWPQAKLRVLLLAGRKPEAVALAEQRLEPATQAFEQTVEQYKALGAKLRDKPGDADTAARLKALEPELAARAVSLYVRREQYVEVCVEAGEHATAEKQVRAWLAAQPGAPQFQQWLVQVLLAGKRTDDALEALKQIIPKTPVDVLKVMTWRAQALAAGGQDGAAVNELTSLLNEGFVRADAAVSDGVRRQIVTLLVEAKDYPRAADLCDEWLKGVAEGDKLALAQVLTLKRHVLLAADREAESAAVSERLLELDPYDPELNNDLGYTWVDRGEHVEQALPMIKLAVAAEPLNAAYLDSLGWAYYKTGEFDRACTYLSRAVQLHSGQDAVIYDHLGDAEYRLGDANAARENWRKALGRLEAPPSGRERGELDARVLAALRSKLAAVEKSEPPPVAPTAAEQPRSTSHPARPEDKP